MPSKNATGVTISSPSERGRTHISDWAGTGDPTAVEALFANLDTQDADLIVAGAFGRSRIYEGLFGG
jgi:nucleotide-binding universal stress UspA family protein